MMNTPLSSNRQLVRYLLAGPLLMATALGYAATHTHQAAPAGSIAGPARQVPAGRQLGAGAVSALGQLPTPAAWQQASAASAPTLPLAARSKPVRTAQLNPAQAGPGPIYYVDGKLVTEAVANALDVNTIADIRVLKDEAARRFAGAAGANGVVVITTKANQHSPTVDEISQRLAALDYTPQAASATSHSLPADALYYLNGQPSTRQVIEQLNPDAIASTSVFANEPANWQRLPGLRDSKAPAAILITTKAAAEAAPQPGPAADDYTARSLEMNALLPKTLAYITSHYPDARLNEVQELTQKATGAVKYRVQLIRGRRPFYVYFSPQGEFLGE